MIHEQFWTPAARMADIVLPATTSLERDDIGYGSREPFLIAMKKAREPVGEARDDYLIFSELARRMGARRRLHRRPRHHGVAEASLRAVAREVGGSRRHHPAVRRFLAGRHRRGQGREPRAGDAGGLPRRSGGASAQDAVGQDRNLLREDRLVRLRRLPRPRDLAGADRVAGLEDRRALSAAHAVGPADRQAAQPARPQPAFARHQGQGPPADHHPSRRCDGPRHRRRRSVARVQRPRRLPGGGAPQRPHPPRRGAAVDGRVVRPGGCRTPTGRSRSTAIPTR